jgi:hypothetical protein
MAKGRRRFTSWFKQALHSALLSARTCRSETPVGYDCIVVTGKEDGR